MKMPKLPYTIRKIFGRTSPSEDYQRSQNKIAISENPPRIEGISGISESDMVPISTKGSRFQEHLGPSLQHESEQSNLPIAEKFRKSWEEIEKELDAGKSSSTRVTNKNVFESTMNRSHPLRGAKPVIQRPHPLKGMTSSEPTHNDNNESGVFHLADKKSLVDGDGKVLLSPVFYERDTSRVSYNGLNLGVASKNNRVHCDDQWLTRSTLGDRVKHLSEKKANIRTGR